MKSRLHEGGLLSTSSILANCYKSPRTVMKPHYPSIQLGLTDNGKAIAQQVVLSVALVIFRGCGVGCDDVLFLFFVTASVLVRASQVVVAASESPLQTPEHRTEVAILVCLLSTRERPWDSPSSRSKATGGCNPVLYRP